MDHDRNVGSVLAKLDELGLANDTIVLYGTDNGPHANIWSDGATTPFRSEKNTNWEGAFRVPWLARWPAKIKPGTVSNEIVSHHDWLPTLLAAAGMPDVMDRLKTGYAIGDRTYKVDIDGFNLLPYLSDQENRCPRPCFFYFSDDGDLLGLRYDNWKVIFAEQEAQGTLRVWAQPFTPLRVPKIFNPQTDPYERADITSNTYCDWMIDHAFILVPAQSVVGEFLATFRDYPPRQKAASFSIDQVLAKLQEPGGETDNTTRQSFANRTGVTSPVNLKNARGFSGIFEDERQIRAIV